LYPHEKIYPSRLKELSKKILDEGFLRKPIVVDRKTRVILDGHHRYRILQWLGVETIPVMLVEYSSSNVSVFPRRVGYKVSKQLVVEMALSGRLMPPKTTKHVLEIDIRPVDLPLKCLLKTDVRGDLY